MFTFFSGVDSSAMSGARQRALGVVKHCCSLLGTEFRDVGFILDVRQILQILTLS